MRYRKKASRIVRCVPPSLNWLEIDKQTHKPSLTDARMRPKIEEVKTNKTKQKKNKTKQKQTCTIIPISYLQAALRRISLVAAEVMV